MTRKFKPGDRVRVRQWEDMEREFGLTQGGSINCSIVFAREMCGLCGKTAVIAMANDIRVVLIREEDADSLSWDRWTFTHDMFELADESAINNKETALYRAALDKWGADPHPC